MAGTLIGADATGAGAGADGAGSACELGPSTASDRLGAVEGTDGALAVLVGAGAGGAAIAGGALADGMGALACACSTGGAVAGAADTAGAAGAPTGSIASEIPVRTNAAPPDRKRAVTWTPSARGLRSASRSCLTGGRRHRGPDRGESRANLTIAFCSTDRAPSSSCVSAPRVYP